jgi:hypothetical protein
VKVVRILTIAAIPLLLLLNRTDLNAEAAVKKISGALDRVGKSANVVVKNKKRAKGNASPEHPLPIGVLDPRHQQTGQIPREHPKPIGSGGNPPASSE